MQRCRGGHLGTCRCSGFRGFDEWSVARTARIRLALRPSLFAGSVNELFWQYGPVFAWAETPVSAVLSCSNCHLSDAF